MKTKLSLSWISALTVAASAMAFWLPSSWTADSGATAAAPVATAAASAPATAPASAGQKKDPAAWGKDHAGGELPDYETGDTCLFCHREEAVNLWPSNRHQLTMREPDRPADKAAMAALAAKPELAAIAKEATMMMGDGDRERFLKRSPAYGRVELLSVHWQPPKADDGKLLNVENPHWDADTFNAKCAGCHATAVNPKTMAFSSPSLDCYTCHGQVDEGHTADTSLMILSKKRKDSAEIVVSICSSCHIRTGVSETTKRPYPDNFIAGDNLFKDFKVDFSDEALAKVNIGDRHILENTRDVIYGKTDQSCVTCHNVHTQSTAMHDKLEKQDSCYVCHTKGGDWKEALKWETHSTVCEY